MPPEAGTFGPPEAGAEPKHRSACGIGDRDWQEGVWGWGAEAWAGWPKSFQFFVPLNGETKSHNLGRTLRAGVCWRLSVSEAGLWPTGGSPGVGQTLDVCQISAFQVV